MARRQLMVRRGTAAGGGGEGSAMSMVSWLPVLEYNTVDPAPWRLFSTSV
jgi:hypothetical protein